MKILVMSVVFSISRLVSLNYNGLHFNKESKKNRVLSNSSKPSSLVRVESNYSAHKKKIGFNYSNFFFYFSNSLQITKLHKENY